MSRREVLISKIISHPYYSYMFYALNLLPFYEFSKILVSRTIRELLREAYYEKKSFGLGDEKENLLQIRLDIIPQNYNFM